MDKSYLLHNLKIVDNAEEDHGMLDLEFQNIRYEDQDLIADVIETTRYVGEVNPRIFTTKHENVSLTGSGGSYTGPVTITLKNNTKSDKISVALFESEEAQSPKWALDLAPGATETRTATGGEVIIIQHPIDNIVYSGVRVIDPGIRTSVFSLTSATADFTINEDIK